jgi:leucine-rich repeat protein SHOC2
VNVERSCVVEFLKPERRARSQASMAPVVKRGRGRPKGSKNKAKGASAPVPALKRGRGRPKGSKNRKTPDADLDAEPDVLVCPITRTMFRDPVMVVDSGHTYERSAIVSHFRRNGAKDPLTRRALSSTKVMTNWAVRQIVQDWLDKHPDVTPDDWESRELLEPSKDDGTASNDDGGDVGVLRTWRAMCPELQERWPEAARPEHWEGVTMENGRVVELVLEGFGLTGAVPAEIGRLSALRTLNLVDNQLTSVPAEIGQLTSLERLYLVDNELTSVPAEIGQLTSLTELGLELNHLTSLPAEIWQLTTLWSLNLSDNQLTSVPAEIGRLTSLENLFLSGNQLTSLPAEIWQLTRMDVLLLGGNQLTSLPAEIGQLTALEELCLGYNQLSSVPAEIGQLTSLVRLFLIGNQLTTLPASIRELRAAGCEVNMGAGVTFDE